MTGGTLTLATCGHPSAMIAATDGQAWQLGAASSLLDLGAQPMLVATRLQPRDRVLLSADGLKVRDPQRQFIDLARVLTALMGGLSDEGLNRVLANLHQAVGQELSDDLALGGRLLARRVTARGGRGACTRNSHLHQVGRYNPWWRGDFPSPRRSGVERRGVIASPPT